LDGEAGRQKTGNKKAGLSLTEEKLRAIKRQGKNKGATLGYVNLKEEGERKK